MGPDPSSVAPPAAGAEHRVLLVAPTPRDAALTERFLAAAGIACHRCADLWDVVRELPAGAGCAVVSETALAADAAAALAAALAGQPVWSDLPVVVLSAAGAEAPPAGGAFAALGNVSVVERPTRVSTLLSVVRAALRARRRQYQSRDQLNAERRLREQNRALLDSERAARAEAERAGRLKDEFLATLSHELRTPLNAILGWSQIVRRSPADVEGMLEGLAVIERNARTQVQIIEDLLDMSRIINGKVRLDVRPLDPEPILLAAVDTCRPAADAKGLHVHPVLDGRDGVVNGDAGRLQQVFWNLLSNAVKFTPRGGRVRVALSRADPYLRVVVADSGDGIDPAFLPHVFDRFRQADGTTTRKHGGLGLGLSIVKHLVELHGGTIRADSGGPGTGATFTVTLPLAAAPRDAAADAPPPPAAAAGDDGPAGPPARLAGVRVLVVDDEPDVRQMVRRVLENCDAVVTTAGSAAEAMAALSHARPDVIVSDVGMPGEDGYSLIRRVRAAPHVGDVPAVALTAYARTQDRVSAIAAGFQMHLAKPVEPEELVATVASLSRRKL